MNHLLSSRRKANQKAGFNLTSQANPSKLSQLSKKRSKTNHTLVFKLINLGKNRYHPTATRHPAESGLILCGQYPIIGRGVYNAKLRSSWVLAQAHRLRPMSLQVYPYPKDPLNHHLMNGEIVWALHHTLVVDRLMAISSQQS